MSEQRNDLYPWRKLLKCIGVYIPYRNVALRIFKSVKSNFFNKLCGFSVFPSFVSFKEELQRLLGLLRNQDPLSEEQLKGLCIELNDFLVALSSVQPSAKREGFATVPNVTWADIGALEDIREELTMAILVGVSASHCCWCVWCLNSHACVLGYMSKLAWWYTSCCNIIII